MTFRAKSLVLALASVAATGRLGLAQQTIKVAVVNSARAFESSSEGKKAALEIQTREDKLKADVQKLDDELNAMRAKLDAGRVTMTPEALAGLERDIETKTAARKRFAEDAEKEYHQLQVDLMSKVRDEMVTIINAMAKERGYDLVFDLGGSGLITFNPVLDITDEVVRRYDAMKLGVGPVKK
jgi:outer membrane protein